MRSDIETILEKTGLTNRQRTIVYVTAVAWIFVSMEILLISFVIPILIKIWSLTDIEAGLIGSSTLIGSFIGSILWGRVSDKFGRKLVFQNTILVYSIFTGVSAFSIDFWSLFILRFLAGIGLGGMLVVDPILLSEFLPSQKRGKYMVMLDSFWPVGNLVALFLAYTFLVIGGNNWRLMFLAASFPAFLIYFIRKTVPETPYYLARKGLVNEAVKVLEYITASNNIHDISIRKPEIKARWKDLFVEKRILTATVVTLVAWASLNYSYYGLFIWLPRALEVIRGIMIGNIYTFLFLAIIAQFPGYLTAMYLVDKWGRKKTLSSFLILGGLSGYIFATANSYQMLIIGLFFVSFFNLGAWGAVYPYTVELFPTHLRGTAFGVAAEGVGKIIALLSPSIFGLLLAYTSSIMIPLTTIAIIMLIGGIIISIMGKETKGEKFI